MLSIWIVRYGYLALSVGAFLEGEIVLMSAGAMAHEGLLKLPAVIACALCASVAWDLLWFELGRRVERALMRWRPAWRARSEQPKQWLRRRPLLFVFGYRFAAGMGALGPALVGAAHLDRRRFVTISALGATVWSLVFAGIGWSIGAGMRELVGRVEAWQTLVGGAVSGTLVIWGIAHAVRRARVGAWGPGAIRSGRDT